MIFAGALGNFLIDLLFISTRFYRFSYNNFHWFIFNVADIFITLGVYCLIIFEIILKKKYEKKNFYIFHVFIFCLMSSCQLKMHLN